MLKRHVQIYGSNKTTRLAKQVGVPNIVVLGDLL